MPAPFGVLLPTTHAQEVSLHHKSKGSLPGTRRQIWITSYRLLVPLTVPKRLSSPLPSSLCLSLLPDAPFGEGPKAL